MHFYFPTTCRRLPEAPKDTEKHEAYWKTIKYVEQRVIKHFRIQHKMSILAFENCIVLKGVIRILTPKDLLINCWLLLLKTQKRLNELEVGILKGVHSVYLKCSERICSESIKQYLRIIQIKHYKAFKCKFLLIYKSHKKIIQ